MCSKKTSQNSQVNTRSSHPEMFCQKDVLKNLSKIHKKHLCRSLFFNNVEGRKPETVRSSFWRCSVKMMFLKVSQISQENTCVGLQL